MEIVHDGWLLKSPPPKRLWRAKWRNRWFVLRSGELPGQYFLEYYTDDTRKKLKGKIDLDQCEQVDAGVTFAQRKFECKFMFDIKTPKRIYYLCAETEDAMNRWVDCVCQVCGLKVMNQEDMIDPLAQLNPSTPSTPQATCPPMTFDPHRLMEYPCIDSPPPSASPTISGPYIPISECITGKKPPSSSTTRFPFAHDSSQPFTIDNQRSSIPNEMAPPAPFSFISKTPNNFQGQQQNSGKGAKPRESYDVPRQLRPSATTSDDSCSIQSPSATEGFYVFVLDEEKPQTPSQREDRVFMEGKDAQKVKAQNASDAEAPPPYAAPPRPPKPPHLAEAAAQNYMNLGTIIKANIRRNSSSERSRGPVLPSHLSVPESSLSSSDPEPSPASVSSSAVSNTPKDVSDDMYDFPRSHQAELVCSNSLAERNRRHCYNSSAPIIQGRIFSYDTQQAQNSEKFGETDPRISPVGIYSNIPQNNKKGSYIPPAVDRGLKPKRQSESSSHSASELSPPPSGGITNDIPTSLGAVGGIPASPASAPPIVDRNLKPHKKFSEPIIGLNPPFVLDPAPRSRLRNSEQRKPRAAPSPTPPSLRNGRGNGGSDTDADSSVSSPNSRRDSITDEQIFFPLHLVQRRSSHEIQYLDLDLESQAQVAPGSPKASKAAGMSKLVPSEASVVYKKVDFVKTEAFNKMRQNVEEGYRTGKSSN